MGDEMGAAPTASSRHPMFTARTGKDADAAAHRIARQVLRLGAKYTMETLGAIIVFIQHPRTKHMWCLHSHGEKGERGFVHQLQEMASVVAGGGDVDEDDAPQVPSYVGLQEAKGGVSAADAVCDMAAAAKGIGVAPADVAALLRGTSELLGTGDEDDAMAVHDAVRVAMTAAVQSLAAALAALRAGKAGEGEEGGEMGGEEGGEEDGKEGGDSDEGMDSASGAAADDDDDDDKEEKEDDEDESEEEEEAEAEDAAQDPVPGAGFDRAARRAARPARREARTAARERAFGAMEQHYAADPAGAAAAAAADDADADAGGLPRDWMADADDAEAAMEGEEEEGEDAMAEEEVAEEEEEDEEEGEEGEEAAAAEEETGTRKRRRRPPREKRQPRRGPGAARGAPRQRRGQQG
jgi:hypothetical protein